MIDIFDEIIEFEGLTIHILRSSRRKTLSLEVGHEGIKARAPDRMRGSTIKEFIIKKRDWIRRTIDKLPPKHAPLVLRNGCELPVLGHNYPLQIIEGQKAIYIDDNGQIIVPIGKRSHSPEQTLRNKLIKWYKQVAMRHLELRVKNSACIMLNEAIPPNVKVRDYKRRWGSCDHRGNLSFNWRIVMGPERVMDYVVIHELAHLREFNHSPRFWKIVEAQMPDWKEQQNWLRDNGGLLYRF